MDKEQVYDAEIAPLMEKIIAICQENKIAMVATFAVPSREEPSMLCTTSLRDERGELPGPLFTMVRLAMQSAPQVKNPDSFRYVAPGRRQ